VTEITPHFAAQAGFEPTAQAAPHFEPEPISPADPFAEAGVPQPGIVPELRAQAANRADGSEVIRIRLDQIDKNPYQTRTWMPEVELKQMAESIRTNGVIQPIVVRPAETEGRYVLIMGERRWRASEVAGRQTIPAIVRMVSNQQAAEMTLIENLQRQDISCMDQARAFLNMSQSFKLTQEEIALRVGVSRETVSNYQRLCRLPKEVQHLLLTRQLDFSRARLILRLPEVPELMIRVAQHAVKRDLSVTGLERLLERAFKDAREEIARGKARVVDPNVKAAQRELERTLGLRVKIRDRGGKGRIEIEYGSIDDYDRVVGLLRAGKKK
jgi:ParB family chromosome partitioning protein